MEKHELVDIKGNKTGKILTHIEARNPNNVPKGYYISVVGVVIINDNNEILLQKRSRVKRANPSKWGICGGKVDLGETPLDAGVRETLEEIGVFLDKKDLKFLSMDTNEKAHFTVYYVRKNVNINECKLQEDELEEFDVFPEALDVPELFVPELELELPVDEVLPEFDVSVVPPVVL